MPYFPPSGAGAGDGYNILSAGTQIANTTGTVAFSNSNNITFGMSNSSVITASASLNQSIQTQNMVSVQGSTGNISFSNANGITFGANASTITASHNGITTARASNDAIGLNTAFTNVTATVNSSGLSLNAAGYAGTNTATTGNISVTLNSSGLSLNAPAFLTTAAQSNHSHGNPTLALTNLSGTTASASNGLTLSLSAAAPGAGGDGYNIIGVNGAGTQLSTTVQFSNSNNVSFGLNAGTITATVTFNQSVQTQGMVSVNGSTGNISLATGSSLSSSSNGSTITFGLASNITTALQSAGAYLTTAALSNHSHAFSASGGSSNFQTLNFANSNGITFSNSNGSVIASHNGLTTARASNDGVGLNTAQSNVTWTVNSSGISLDARNYAGTGTTFNGANISGSLTLNSNGLQASMSVAAPGGGAAPTASASNGSFTFNTIGFSNANNVTFGTSAGSIITASVAAPGGGAGFTANSTAIGMENAWAQSSSSLGQNSLYIQPHNLQVALSAIALKLPVMITNSSLASNSGQIGHTVNFGIYTTNATNSTVLALHYSTSYTAALSNSSNVSRAVSLISAINNSTSYATFNSTSAGLNLSSIVHGPREFLMPISSLLTAGKYWFALHQSTSGGGTSNSVFAVSNIIYSSQTNAAWGATSATSLGGIAKNIGIGTYSTTTGAMPTNISITQINKAATQPVMYIVDATS